MCWSKLYCKGDSPFEAVTKWGHENLKKPNIASIAAGADARPVAELAAKGRLRPRPAAVRARNAWLVI